MEIVGEGEPPPSWRRTIGADLLARRERTKAGAFQIAMVHAGLGDLDQTFAWLDRSVDHYSMGSMIMGPTFEELHRDPRFQRLRQRLRVPAP